MNIMVDHSGDHVFSYEKCCEKEPGTVFIGKDGSLFLVVSTPNGKNALLMLSIAPNIITKDMGYREFTLTGYDTIVLKKLGDRDV